MQAPHALSEEQVARYNRDGYLFPLPVFAAEHTKTLRANLEAFEARHGDNAAAQRLELHLLERCTRADGIQIFIGEESGYDAFGGFSVVTAPYKDGSNTLGVLGVIGPTRMAYERVIPIVDVTAKVLSSVFSSES